MPTAVETAPDAGARPGSIRPPSPPAPPAAPDRRRWPLAVAALAIATASVVAVRVWSRMFATPVAAVVTASGRIEGREMTVAPKDIQGRIVRLYVDEGDTVTQGQLLAELEANALDAKAATIRASIANIDALVAQATLDVTLTTKSSAASIAAAEAAVSVTQARIVRARAVRATSEAEQERATTLLGEAVISKHEFDLADLSLRTAEADLAAAEKDLTHAEADLALAVASRDGIAVKQQQVRALQESRRAAEGQLAELQANIAERRILAPADGTVLSRPVEVGDVVSPGSPVFELVDLRRLYVKVYVPEPDIPKLKLGDRADVSVDAFKGRTFEARITKISDQAEFTPKNVETTDERLKLVFGVEVTFVNPDRLLKPGMPADCVIHHGS
ncbi:MAG TPA: efflux RND transporter periplasmic adaptor subunit [Vicinamibacterales bacterium]|nr:efflux RND transporter periplasmic adaptor subunit [Vicinamibacterales bacterium]